MEKEGVYIYTGCHIVFITSRGKQYATTCFHSFHPTSLSIHLFPQWLVLHHGLVQPSIDGTVDVL